MCAITKFCCIEVILVLVHFCLDTKTNSAAAAKKINRAAGAESLNASPHRAPHAR